MKQAFKNSEQRGFLLIVVIGLLAVLLTVCIGFLSYTRGEVGSVASLRDKNDTMDVMHSAVDWTLANMANDLLAGDQFNSKTPVSSANDGTTWWYRPYEMGLSTSTPQWNWAGFPVKPLPYIDPKHTEAPWTYLPPDFFPMGGVRGRFAVQVFDLNCMINLNDWNEDCNPTQCQMAHMIMDSLGDHNHENIRAARDGVIASVQFGDTSNGSTTIANIPDASRISVGNKVSGPGIPAGAKVTGVSPGTPLSSVTISVAATADNTQAQYSYSTSFSVVAPLRYQEAWRLGTHTTRFNDWGYFYGSATDNIISYNWVTANTSWMGLYEPDMGCLRALLATDGVPLGSRVPNTVAWNSVSGSPYYYPPDPPDGKKGSLGGGSPNAGTNPWSVGDLGMYINGFTLQSYVDPDTGRSPVNVNTCYNSGELLPYYVYPGQGTYTIEGVFNIDSLRRIIKIGDFYTKAGIKKNVQTDWATLQPDEKETAAELATKLAYQYQETLCRYFTGTYSHSNSRKYPPYKAAIGTYAAAYGGALTNACTVTDYSRTRFNTDLKSFRNGVRDDLLKMTAGNINSTYTGANPPPATTSDTVGFDSGGRPQIAQGKLDMRTAAAVYDNIVPGKPADLNLFMGFVAYAPGDPLWELASMGLGRQEDVDDLVGQVRNGRPFPVPPPPPPAPPPPTPYNVYGMWVDNPKLSMEEKQGATFHDHYGGSLTVAPKGCDICENDQYAKGPWSDNIVAHVPFRQRAFSPDCFSTELTTTSTTFMLIVNAELVDAATVSANPTDPTKHRDLFWNQWGVVVELAPDVVAETEVKPSGVGAQSEFNYYQRGFPRLRKTDPWWMDNADENLCDKSQSWVPPAAVGQLPKDTGLPWGFSNAQQNPIPKPATYTWPNPHTAIPRPAIPNPLPPTVPSSSYYLCPTLLARNLGSGGADRITTNLTAINTCDWQTDIRGLPPAAGKSQIRIPQTGGVYYDESNFYAGTNPKHRQTTKRVNIRSIWALNQGLMR